MLIGRQLRDAMLRTEEKCLFDILLYMLDILSLVGYSSYILPLINFPTDQIPSVFSHFYSVASGLRP